jgi:hypothetical protein
MAEGEIVEPARKVIEHWDRDKLLGRHWEDHSDECVLCNVKDDPKPSRPSPQPPPEEPPSAPMKEPEEAPPVEAKPPTVNRGTQ